MRKHSDSPSSEERTIGVNDYCDKLTDFQKVRFLAIRSLIHEVVPEVKEKIWSNGPEFYLEAYEHLPFHKRPMINLIFFHDHLNLFSCANREFRKELSGYQVTDKNTIQIYDHQELPIDILRKLVKRALRDRAI